MKSLQVGLVLRMGVGLVCEITPLVCEITHLCAYLHVFLGAYHATGKAVWICDAQSDGPREKTQSLIYLSETLTK